MKPNGKVQRQGCYSNYGSFSKTDRQHKFNQAPGPRVHSVVRSVASLVMHSMVQFFEGMKTRVADYRFQKASEKFVCTLKTVPDKKTADDVACALEKTLEAAKQFCNAARIPVDQAIDRFLEELDEMDTEEYETLLIRLTAMTADVDPVKDEFRMQIVATLRAGISSDMDSYALRALDGLVAVCGRESIRIIDVAAQRGVFAFLSMRSKMIERHPETVSASSYQTDRSIQRWFERQTVEVQDDFTVLVSQIAKTPEGVEDDLAETRLRTFCKQVSMALQFPASQ